MQTATTAAVPAAEDPSTPAPAESAPAADWLDDDDVGGLQIAVLERGFVFVGQALLHRGWLHLTDASCICRWGTTRGLGQLATEGPQPDTRLDPAGEVKSPLSSVIALISCDPAKWPR